MTNFGHSFEKKENLTENEILKGTQDAEMAKNQGDRWLTFCRIFFFIPHFAKVVFFPLTHFSEQSPCLVYCRIYAYGGN